MEIGITPLTKAEIIRQMAQILLLDQIIVGEKWVEENFLVELPDKWQLSFQAQAGDLIAGFLIASRKMRAIHIHRLVVGNRLQNMGVGKRLVNSLIETSKERGMECITLKVLNTNKNAIEFYKKLGFKLKDRENHNIWMELYLNN